MADDYTIRFAVLCLAGIGMTLAGGLNLLFVRLAGWWRVPAAGAIGAAVAAAGVSAVFSRPDLGGLAAGLVAAGVLACAVAGPATAVVRRVAGLVVRPVVPWALLLAGGLATVAAAAVEYDRTDEARIDQDMELLGLDGATPPLIASSDVRAVTDAGNPIPLHRPASPRSSADLAGPEQSYLRRNAHSEYVIRREPAEDRTNCHGWVFTGGRYWISGRWVDAVLAENGYTPVSDPRPGDVVVYRQAGTVAHSGLVRYVADGMPVLVEGKWGCLGVYLHPVDKSPYGNEYTFFRSPRRGHLLTGLADAPTVR